MKTTTSVALWLMILFCPMSQISGQTFDDDDAPPWNPKIRSLRYYLCDQGMTAVDPPTGNGATSGVSTPQEPPVLVTTGKTAGGRPLEYYSDGSTKEFHGDGVLIVTMRDGTKIETILHDTQGNQTTVVIWPSGYGYIRYADGRASRIEPDGTISDSVGTIEVLPGGVIRHTVKDEGVIIDHYPDGSRKLRPDLVDEMKAKGTWTISQSGAATSRRAPGQILLESSLVLRSRLCSDNLLGALLRSDASTAGVPRPITEVAATVGEKKPGLFESLAPVLIPSFSIGIGRGGERDRREPERR